MKNIRILALVAATVAAVGAQAVTFTLVNFTGTTTTLPNTLATGGNVAFGPNFATISAPQAIVGDGQPIRSGTLFVEYNAQNLAPMVAINMVLNLQGFLQGSGTLAAVEEVFELDGMGQEVPGGPIATIASPVLNSSTPIATWSQTQPFARPVTNLKVKKTIYLNANPDTQGFDIAQLGTVNQSITIVPEPGTMLALGAGLAMVAARRRRAR